MRLNVALPEPSFVDTYEKAQAVLAQVMQAKHVGLDTETTGLDTVRDHVVCWSLSDGKDRWCILREFLPVFTPFFHSLDIVKVLTNVKFDKHMLANAGIDLRGTLWDTVVMDWLLNVNGQHGLKQCIKKYGILNATAMQEFAQVFLVDPDTGKRRTMKKDEGLEDILLKALAEEPDKVIEYASLDAWASLQLGLELRDRLENLAFDTDYSAWDHYIEVEEPFTHVLWRCERRGICVDVGHLEDISPGIQTTLVEIEKHFAQMAGHMVNLRSPKALRELFYQYDEDEKQWLDPFNHPCIHWTAGGTTGNRMPSTAKLVLEKWAEDGLKEAQILLDHRHLSKLYDTYIKKMSQLVDAHYRVHTTLNQAGTQTGRLSSSGPNLQNIPTTDKDEFGLRGAFVAGDGKRLLVYDYSQLEMRIMAHMSQDPGMIEAINAGLDIHCDTAAKINGRPYEEYYEAKQAENPTDEQLQRLWERKLAKNSGFLIIYGGGPAKLAVTAGISIPEAKQAIAQFRAARPGIARYTDYQKDFAHNHKFVRTLVGRYRHLPFIDSREDHGMSERAAVNTPIQGSAADIAKVAMLWVDSLESDRFSGVAEELRDLGCQLLLQVHDELIFEIPDDDEVEAACFELIEHVMTHPFRDNLSVPLPIDGGSGYSWAEAK
tara:strand:- start:1921 stop:3894 length:1974 start_codon:yes stop_codon:yes gene_type:complete